jgi:ubiquinone/menaquinone biosynthesis C-methylase UbiE
MKRFPSAELLDTDAGTAEEIADSLRDLRGFNRRFGGISATQRIIEQVARHTPGDRLSLLEVAAGSGYVAETVRERLRGNGIALDLTLLDRAQSHLGHGTTAVVADALAIPFPASSFDLVSCNLFVHHLSPAECNIFFREALRVCRRAVLVNDLVRDFFHLTLVYATRPFYRSRLTKHDAPASVRQAYTEPEMRSMLIHAGASQVEMGRYFLFRMGAIAWK